MTFLFANLLYRSTAKFTMAHKTWYSVKETLEELQIDRKQLFKMRDDGTFKLGTHYAAFPETRSRDSFRWNVGKMKSLLSKQKKVTQDTNQEPTVSSEENVVSFDNHLTAAA